jgi:(p)ppGpp synthase/HD superfamily hydrolase
VQHAAAWLHDVIEDTEVTAEDLLKEGIPDNVVGLVKILTRGEHERYVDYIRRILTDPDARAVKREDLLDNMQSLSEGSLRDKYELSLFILDNV